MPAYSYIRFSSKKQELGDSERRQLEDAKRWCKANQLTLDLTFKPDRGLSAHKGKNISKGSLGLFLKAIENGKVKPGDYLIVESLDRLSRKEPKDALQLILTNIISAGIVLVTLHPEQIYTAKSIKDNPSQLFLILGVIIRANEESEIKSARSNAKWNIIHALQRARDWEGLAKLPKWQGGKFPTWLHYDSTNPKKCPYFLDQEKAAILKRAIKMAIAGQGAYAIATQFNAEKVPVIGKGKFWEPITLQRIFQSKILIGEKQICTISSGKQTPIGEPIKNYYPALIEEKTFYQLQNSLQKRSTGKGKGRDGKVVANLFGSILKSGFDGSRMGIWQPGPKYKYLVSSASQKKLSDHSVSFGYDVFEAEFLRWIEEVRFESIQPIDSNLDQLLGRLSEIDSKLSKLKAHKDLMDFDELISIMKDLSSQKKELQKAIEAAKSKQQKPAISTADVAKLIAKMNSLGLEDRHEVRAKLRSTIWQLCQEIKMYNFSQGRNRLAIVHVKFQDGSDKTFMIFTRSGVLDHSFGDGLKWPNHTWDDESFRHAAEKIAKVALARMPQKVL